MTRKHHMHKSLKLLLGTGSVAIAIISPTLLLLYLVGLLWLRHKMKHRGRNTL